MFGDAFGGQVGLLKVSQPVDIAVTLECTLHEFYNGCLKRIEFDRDVLQHDGRTVKSSKEEMNVEVKPGFSDQTVLKFPSKGNEAHAQKASGLIVKFKQASHENYRRKDNDLIYTQKVTLEQALLSETIQIRALDGRNIVITLDEVITPKTTKYIQGEGMPVQRNGDILDHLKTVEEIQKGDLYLRFDIQFPKKITNECKQTIIQALRKNEEDNAN